jgi:integrase
MANPRQRAGKFIGNGTVEGIVPFTAEEAQGIIDRVGQVYGPMERALLTLLLRTGMRIGEALAFDWGDVDFEARLATITKNWDYRRKKIGRPKTKRSREVDLTPATVEALKALREVQGEDYHGPLFIDGSGNRLVYDAVVAKFRRCWTRLSRPVRSALAGKYRVNRMLVWGSPLTRSSIQRIPAPMT